MRRSNFALRLQPSLMEEARKAAQAEGVAFNQLINLAVAEKVSTLRTENYFSARAARADRKAALRALARAGNGNAPLPGDELPLDGFSRKEIRPTCELSQKTESQEEVQGSIELHVPS